MTRPFRNILAVTLVAMALCADRATAAAPAVRPQISQVTRQVVRQITRRFQHVVPAVKIVESRQEGLTRVVTHASPPDVPADLHASECSPFQFRLPPPTV